MIYRAIVRFALPLAAMLVAPGAAAQQPERGDDDIVVEGQARPPAKRTERFVRHVVATNEGQLARFVDPVCPLILGMPQSAALGIDDRLRRVAASAGVRVAPDRCEANLVVAVAADADAFVRTMRKRHSSFFDDLSDVDLRDAFRAGQVHAWRLVEDRDREGAPIAGDPPMAEVQSGSAFALPTQAATVNAVVIFGKRAVLDKTIAQIADYVAMRALAGARPPAAGELDRTILSLFDSGQPPPLELTAMDRRLLTGLYAIPPTGSAASQVHRISRHMAGDAPAN